MLDLITVHGARQHNLKNLDVEIPHTVAKLANGGVVPVVNGEKCPATKLTLALPLMMTLLAASALLSE